MAGNKIEKPKKTNANSGAPIGSEHHSPSSIDKSARVTGSKFSRHGEKDTIVKAKIDKAVKSEYKGEKSNEALMGSRYSGVRGDTTHIGAGNAEDQFRKKTSGGD